MALPNQPKTPDPAHTEPPAPPPLAADGPASRGKKWPFTLWHAWLFGVTFVAVLCIGFLYATAFFGPLGPDRPLRPVPDGVPGPDLAAAARATPPAPLPRAVLESWKPETPLSPRWTSVVIHHTATAGGTVESLDRGHRQRGMENGLAYHFLIGNGHGLADGAIYPSPRWRRQLDGGHVRGPAHNRVALGVCLVGDFENGDGAPTPAQVAALKALLNWLLPLCGLADADVRGHQAYPGQATLCPGRRMPLADIVETRLAAGKPAVDRPAAGR